MATITPTNITTAGQAITFVAASAGGDTIAGAGNPTTQLQVKNGSGSPITVTFTGVVPCSQGATHNSVATIAAGALEYLDVPPQSVDPVTGNAAVTYSAVTTVTVAAITT
jgi:hypothetical protein